MGPVYGGGGASAGWEARAAGKALSQAPQGTIQSLYQSLLGFLPNQKAFS